jgi:MoxR-like ATPase
MVELVHVSRRLEPVALGASVRASLALERTARAWALMNDRDYVTPGDVELLFLPVLGHRIIFTPSFLAEARNLGREQALETFRRLCFEQAPRPEPDEEHELRVLGGYSG